MLLLLHTNTLAFGFQSVGKQGLCFAKLSQRLVASAHESVQYQFASLSERLEINICTILHEDIEILIAYSLLGDPNRNIQKAVLIWSLKLVIVAAGLEVCKHTTGKGFHSQNRRCGFG